MGFRVVPPLLVDEEDVLGLGEPLHGADLVLAQARVLALEGGPLAASRVRVEAHADLHLSDVGVDGNELRERVAVGLPGLPGRRRRRGQVGLGDEHHPVRVQEVHERSIVLAELLRGGPQRPGVGDLDRAAQRRSKAVDLDRWRDVVDLRVLPSAAGGDEGRPPEDQDERPLQGTSMNHQGFSSKNGCATHLSRRHIHLNKDVRLTEARPECQRSPV